MFGNYILSNPEDQIESSITLSGSYDPLLRAVMYIGILLYIERIRLRRSFFYMQLTNLAYINSIENSVCNYFDFIRTLGG